MIAVIVGFLVEPWSAVVDIEPRLSRVETNSAVRTDNFADRDDGDV